MNLYRVECHGMFDSVWVYVAAKDPCDAQEKAIAKMRDLKWKYDGWAGTVETVACGDHNRKSLFVA